MRFRFFLLALTLFLLPSPLLAFTPQYIVADEDLFDAKAMSLRDIQRFLESRPGTLHYYLATDTDGAVRTVTEMIWRAAERYSINPKYLLTTLQKEQSLIDDPHPSKDQYDWAMGFAICDTCEKDHPGLQQYRGLATQIDRAAWRNRYYVDHPEEFQYAKGKMVLTDGVPVTPINQATANLYNYTPHIRGNKSFFEIFTRWFVKQHPDGTLLQGSGSPGVWLIQGGSRRPIASKSVLKSRFNPESIIVVSPRELERYPQGPVLKFANYSLLRASWGTVYLLVDDTRRGIVSREVLRQIGFHPEEIVPVTEEDLLSYTEGAPLTLASVYPTGALLRDRSSGAVFSVIDGKRHRIASPEILKINFPRRPLITVAPTLLDQFEEEPPVLFRDGTLIKTAETPKIYVISRGFRRHISTFEIFTSLGYTVDDVVTVSPGVLEMHPEGEPIEFYTP